jgi:hypothetical protein
MNTSLAPARLSPSRTAFLAVGLVLFCGSLWGAQVTEQEPNNDLAHANPVQCGDSVICATLVPYTDYDNFRFSVVAGDSIILTTFPCGQSQTNTLIALVNEQDSVLAVDDDSGPELFSRLRYRTTVSADYFARVVLQRNSVDSAYSLAVECPHYTPEDYDLCSGARILPAFPCHDEGTTAGMTSQCGNPSPDVFYRFYNPVLCNVFLALCSQTFDARIQLMGSCCQDFLDDASDGCGNGAVLYVFNLEPGDYSLMIEGTALRESGFYTLDIAAQMPGCPAPGPVVITTIGGYPFLDWPQLAGPSYYVVWQSNSANGAWEHLGTTLLTFYCDSTGYAGARRFYQVTATCPW